MGPALSPGQVGQEAAACAVLGACLGAGRAFFPVRGRGALLPDVLLMAAFCWAPRAMRPPSAPGACRAGTCWQQPLQALHWQSTCWGFRCGPWAGCCAGRWMGWQNMPRPMPGRAAAKRRPKNAGTKKDLQKNRKRTCQVSGACCIIQTYQSKSTGAKSLLYVRGLTL